MSDIQNLRCWFNNIADCLIACSGGIDSLLLATVAHRTLGDRVTIVHAISPAVPPDATLRVHVNAASEGWQLNLISGDEFYDEQYLKNPINRCFYCKTHLYSMLNKIAILRQRDCCVISGANIDDLGEYRPGLSAASQYGVRHPYIELGFGKSSIRAMVKELKLDYAELPASPCLASRLYTGTRVTAERMNFVYRAEQMVRELTGCSVVRCRIDESVVRIEVPEENRILIDNEVITSIHNIAQASLPEISAVMLDTRAYAPGRAFVGAP